MLLVGRALLFVLVFGALQLGWQMLDGGALHHLLIDEGIVAPAARAVHVLSPDLPVQAAGHRLLEPHGGLNIVNGCDGMETLFMLLAAFAVAPIPVRARISGLLVGIPITYILNQVRILVLFYAHRGDSESFDVLHGIVTPILMVVSIVAFYYVWLRRSQQYVVS
jgi:exosortase/archaeosortase family protein